MEGGAKDLVVYAESYDGGESLAFVDSSDDPPSTVKDVDLARYRTFYGFPQSSKLELPFDGQRASCEVPGMVCLYELAFTIGLRLPLLKFVIDVLSYSHIAPGQLMPNAWRVVLGLLVLSEAPDVVASVDVLLHAYSAKGVLPGNCRLQLNAKSNTNPLIILGGANDRCKWKEKYFMVDVETVFGWSDTGGVPTSWRTINLGACAKRDIGEDAINMVKKIRDIPTEIREASKLLNISRLARCGIWQASLKNSRGSRRGGPKRAGSLLDRYSQKPGLIPPMPLEDHVMCLPPQSGEGLDEPVGQTITKPTDSRPSWEVLSELDTSVFGCEEIVEIDGALCHSTKVRVDNIGKLYKEGGAPCLASYIFQESIRITHASGLLTKAMIDIESQRASFEKEASGLAKIKEELAEARREASDAKKTSLELHEKLVKAEREASDAKKELDEVKGELAETSRSLEATIADVEALKVDLNEAVESREDRVILSQREVCLSAIERGQTVEDLLRACEAYLVDHDVPIPS